jgi:hypothetical protein
MVFMENSQVHRGRCLCGAVKYEIDGKVGPIIFCHCSHCRKANGSAFLAAAPVSKEGFRLLSGSETLKEYESSPGVYRVFCGECASPLFSKRNAMPDTFRLRIGTLETPLEQQPVAHIFVSDKAEWFEICDKTPQYAERPDS